MFAENDDIDDPLSIFKNFNFGEEKAFDFFFRKHYAALCFFAGSYLPNPDDAKDVVQDCFVKLWARHTTVTHPEALKSYLYTTVRNACLHVIRNQKKAIRINTELHYTTDRITSDELNEITHAEMIGQIHERMAELPDRMQEVFRKFYIEGKDQERIAKELQRSPITIRNQRLRALVILREKLLSFTTLAFFLLHY